MRNHLLRSKKIHGNSIKPILLHILIVASIMASMMSASANEIHLRFTEYKNQQWTVDPNPVKQGSRWEWHATVQDVLELVKDMDNPAPCPDCVDSGLIDGPMKTFSLEFNDVIAFTATQNGPPPPQIVNNNLPGYWSTTSSRTENKTVVGSQTSYWICPADCPESSGPAGNILLLGLGVAGLAGMRYGLNRNVTGSAKKPNS